MQTTSVPRAPTKGSWSTPRTTTASRPARAGARALRLRGQAHARPASVGAADVEELRRHGWDDEAIHDAIQVIAYFNYINRIAEAVGIGPEPEWEER